VNSRTKTGKPQRRAIDDRAQSKRFLEAARKAEADETEEGARHAFKKVVDKPKRGVR
jgi:hypothetical protein